MTQSKHLLNCIYLIKEKIITRGTATVSTSTEVPSLTAFLRQRNARSAV